MDVEFEWAGGELLHPAHGRAQRRTIETCGEIGPQIFFRRTNVELLQATYHRSEREGLCQFSPTIIRRALAIGLPSIQQWHNDFAGVLTLPQIQFCGDVLN